MISDYTYCKKYKKGICLHTCPRYIKGMRCIVSDKSTEQYSPIQKTIYFFIKNNISIHTQKANGQLLINGTHVFAYKTGSWKLLGNTWENTKTTPKTLLNKIRRYNAACVGGL